MQRDLEQKSVKPVTDSGLWHMIRTKIFQFAKSNEYNSLEIGPGTGKLSSFIIEKKPKKFLAVEKDKNLSSFLQKEFNNNNFYITKTLYR